jgi:hypothetical protein
MNAFFRQSALFICLSVALGASITKETLPVSAPLPPNPAPKIQAAILLDVSSSMNGLIEQAKSQLWNMVSVMGRANCNGVAPKIEIALYEYGSPRNDIKKGFVKQLSPFTTDLDGLSAKLFSLTTDGGNEYCGQVIYTSIDELSWDTSSLNYKVIFIAGNEDFLQGSVHYTEACKKANEKGILVNTIYCGDRMQGIKEHWNLLGECGNGSYTNIDQNVKEEYIATPYDSNLLVLNTKLNGTYVTYGWRGEEALNQQASVDKLNTNANKSMGLKRVAVKGQANAYRNSGWDLVDAVEDDSSFIEKVELKTLPDSLKNKTRAQIKQVVVAKQQERSLIRKEITKLNGQRENFLVEEKKRRAGNSVQTLESETEKMIRQQAKRYNMTIN